MFFDDYKIYHEAKVNPALLWEYDLGCFDYLQMRQVVVERVVERWKDDW
jgi:hypothetical protein